MWLVLYVATFASLSALSLLPELVVAEEKRRPAIRDFED
jgi:hypothetical protein